MIMHRIYTQRFYRLALAIVLVFSIFTKDAVASTISTVNELISSGEEIEGVVFEVLEFDDNVWSWVSAVIKESADLLKSYDEGIDVVVVSHGLEQFQLVKRSMHNTQNLLLLKDMVKNNTISLNVCGAHSAMYFVPEDDYIEEVKVVDSGPATINDYRNLGYTIILINNQ